MYRQSQAEDLSALLVRRWPERRVVVLAASVLLTGVVFLLRLADSAPADAVGLLFVIPVALVALELGVRGGVLAGLGATALLVGAAEVRGPELSVAGYVTRAVVFLAVGAITGHFADRMRGAQERQATLLRCSVELARLDEDADLAAILARALVELAPVTAATVTLADGSRATAGGPGGDHRVTLDVGIPAATFGTAEITVAARHVSVEDRAAAAALALQAAVAADNRQLLRRERERAALEGRLAAAQRHVEAQRRGLRAVLDDHEDRRGRVAAELHEETAQALSAVLLGLQALQRRINADEHDAELERLRLLVRETVSELRRIAEDLRPVTLDQLGLEAGLNRLAASAAGERGRSVTIQVLDLDEAQLPRELQTAIFRLAEDCLRVLEGGVWITVAGGGGDTVRLDAWTDGRAADPEHPALELLHARTEPLGGRVAVLDGRIAISLPLDQPLRLVAGEPQAP